jgi:hypothetical protein
MIRWTLAGRSDEKGGIIDTAFFAGLSRPACLIGAWIVSGSIVMCPHIL